MTAPTPRADHAELARLAEAAAPYWHAANLACGGNPIAVDLVAPFVGAMSPAVCSALLSEIAALRGEVERVEADRIRTVDDRMTWTRRTLQAERQRDELRKALKEAQRRLTAAGDFFGARLANEALINQGAE